MTSMDTPPRTISLWGHECRVHTWNHDKSSKNNKKALCIIYHGLGAHGQYPTVRYAAQTLADQGYVVVAVDMPGHGQSEGLPLYLPSAQAVVEAGQAIADYATSSLDPSYQQLPLFLIGSSMGGAIALAVSHQRPVTGVVLLGPMLQLKVSDVERSLLAGLAAVGMGTWSVIPSSATSSDKQCRDPVRRQECDQDPYVTKSKSLRVASALTCVDLTRWIQAKASEMMDLSFLVLVADEDVVVDNKGSLALMEKSPSKDKTIKHYPALHALLCEPSPLVDQIQADMLAWIAKRLK